MAIGDLYQLTLTSTLRGQQLVNAFYYVQREGEPVSGNPATALATEFDLNFTAVAGVALRGNIFSALVEFSSIRTLNLFNPADFHEILYDPDIRPSGSGDTMPNFVALAFRTAWLGGVVRRGFKRFGGIMESVVDNGVLSAASLAQANTLAANLSTTLEATTAHFSPCVVKRIKEGSELTGYTYRLPENAGEAVYVEDVVYSTITTLTTQNSRKIGRGS